MDTNLIDEVCELIAPDVVAIVDHTGLITHPKTQKVYGID